ncbi:MAG: TIGR03790 family protein [Nitrospira sp.]|nr:TIGR03790 family protein [Nitrospira sp.]
MILTLRSLTFACLLVLIDQASFARADPRPHHVAILANAKSPESVAVAQHYAAKRDIPADHIIRLDLPLRDTLARREYEDLVVTPLRRTLEARRLSSSIRVIVTTYGIPLRVEAPRLSANEQSRLTEARGLVKTSRTKLERLEAQFEKMSPGSQKPKSTPPDSAQNILETARTAALLSQVDRAWRAALEAQQRSDSESDRSAQELVRLTRQYGGWGILLQKKTGSEQPAAPPDTPQTAAWRALLERSSPLWTGLSIHPITSERPLIYRWAERLFGVRGVLELASAEVDRLTYTHADASLDSELSLLWWDRDLYPVAWRWGNPLFEGTVPTQDELPVLMVSRLDAPTAELAKGLVDKALQAERAGLDGTVYFDARGLQPGGATDTYGLYDHSLRKAAALVKEHSSFRVVLDDAEPTMTAIPDVALYIGWYKLRAYDDVFSFNPGAIGYHMASAEAVTVHDRNERGWCKNALARGITATLGSVGEPYLDAFPEPARFTALLLTGKYSLVEVYYLTSRTISWRMVLFGDPLYNPMKGRSAMPASPLPVSPSERRLSDPLARLTRAHDLARDRQKKLISLLLQAEQASAPSSQ